MYRASNTKNIFEVFIFESLIELTESYLDDFNSTQPKVLDHKLNIYIDNIEADEKFANLNTISRLARMMVGKKNILLFLWSIGFSS